MAGFAGFYKTNGDKSTLKKMMEEIKHRGSDYNQEFHDDFFHLAFGGLDTNYIFDGRELFESKRNLVLLVGYLANIDELREYIREQYDINSEEFTPSELIENTYAKEGKKVANQIKGNYVVLIYEKDTGKLVIIRDRFATQPVYYYQTENGLIFASEMKSILAHPNFKKELNEDALVPYLVFQAPSLKETFFKGLYTFEPGYYLEYAKNKLTTTQYWDVKFDQESISKEEAAETIEKLIDKSIENRTKYYKSKSDISAFLSSGVDSSFLAAKFLPEKTFTVGYDDKEFSEIDNAKALTDILGIENISEVINSEEVFAELKNIVRLLEMPYANLSALPMYFVSKKASEHTKVCLVGDGADEIFGGYYEYTESDIIKRYKKLPEFIRKALGNYAKNTSKQFRGKHILIKGLPVEDWFIGQASIFSQNDAFNIVNEPFKNAPTIKEIVKPYFDVVWRQPDLIKKQYLDFHFFMINDVAVKSDRMNIGNQVQILGPILDEDVLEYSSKLPVSLKVHGTKGKLIFRYIAHKYLPKEWSTRKKIGYVVPLKKWLKEEKYSKIIKEKLLGKTSEKFFDIKQIENLYGLNMQNKRETHRQLWTIFMFIMWYEEFFGEVK